MNILIENDQTLEYLTSTGQWTKNIGDGRRFEGTEPAYRTAKREPIGRFNIVCYISETGQFINLNHGRGKGTEHPPVAGDAPLLQAT